MNKAWFEKELFKNTSPVDLLVSIKELPYNDTKKYINLALRHPFTKAALYNKSYLPDSLVKLSSSRKLNNSFNLDGEMAWMVMSLLKHSKELITFLEYESKIEELILKNNLKEALELLDIIDEKICYSFWSIELRFSIEEKLNGSERNWFLLNEINQGKFNNTILLFSHFYSKKAENDISISQYKREIENLIERANREYSEYLSYKLAYTFSDDNFNYSSILNIENPSSIIDKYLLIVDILIDLSTQADFTHLVKAVIDDFLKEKICDLRLIRLKEYVNISVNQVDNFDLEILEYMDCYSKGKYDDIIKNTVQIITKHPYSIELYEIYIVSLLELKLDFKKTEVSKFIDEILYNLFEIYRKGENYLSCKETLLKLCLSFSKINFFNQLHSLVHTLTNISTKKETRLKYFTHSHFSNPQLIYLIDNDSINFFKLEKKQKYLALKINNYIHSNNEEDFETLVNIPYIKKQIYKTRSNSKRGINNNIDQLLEIRKNTCNIHSKEEIGLYIFEYYYNAKEINHLISFIIDAYFENKFLIERINRQLIVDYVFDNNYEIGGFSVDFPIFFHLHKLDSFYLYSALESYLDSLSFVKPSEIEINSDDLKHIFLLHKVCTPEVLNNFYLVYENNDEVIKERIDILKKLISVDSKNEELYLDEIATLLKNQKLSKTIQTFNDGKISLNFDRIKEDKEYSILNSYNRFIKFREVSDKNEYSLIDINDVIVFLLNENSNEISKAKDASFLSFKSLVIEIVEQFLFSKEHGLDGDLSTRFRHGEIENSIRSVFQANNLIANKNKLNVYNDIDFWNNYFEEKNIDSNITTKFQATIKDFSKNIDDYIFIINNELIQIKSNRHQIKKNGILNYNFPDDFLLLLYNELSTKINSYDDFLNAIFEFLEIYTEQILYNISEDFKTKVNIQFQSFINDLHNKLEFLIKDKQEIKVEVNKEITMLKSELEAELYNISNWFKVNKTSINTNLDIETIVQAALNLVKKPVIPQLKLNTNCNFIRGHYYIDIFKILIENSINHSEVEIDDLDLIIEVENKVLESVSTDNVLISETKIIIQNNISKNIDKNQLKNKLEIIKSNWSNDLSLVNKERGSGFQKIGRRLKYDIVVIDSKMNYEIENQKLKIIIEITNPYTNEEF